MYLVPQRFAIDVFHGDKLKIVVSCYFIDVSYMRMIQRRRSAGLLIKAPHSILVRGQTRRQDFERNSAIQLFIQRQINFTHSPSTESTDDFKVSDVFAWIESHGREKKADFCL
jgi:hypothetical protein